MIFSSYHKSPSSESILKLIEKPGTPLEDILDQNDSLEREIRLSNGKVISYLCKPPIFDALVCYISEMPQNLQIDLNESHKDLKLTKYPFIVTNILTQENEILANYFLGILSASKIMDIETETIPDDEVTYQNDDGTENDITEAETDMVPELPLPFERLMKFMDSQYPLNPTLAGYFSKVLLHLLNYKPDATGNLMYNEYQTSLEQMVRHLYLDWIGATLQAFIQLDYAYYKTSSETFINQRASLVGLIIQNLFQKPFEQMEDWDYKDLQSQSADLLGSFLKNARSIPNGRNIIQLIISAEIIQKIMENLMIPTFVGSISGLIKQYCEFFSEIKAPKSLNILSEMNQTPVNCAKFDLEPIDCEIFFEEFSKSIQKISDVLSISNDKISPEEIKSQYGQSSHSFGKHRTDFLEVLNIVFNQHQPIFESRVAESSLLKILLHLIITNPFSDIIQQYVVNIIQLVIDSTSEAMKLSLLKDANILDFIIECSQDPEVTIDSKLKTKIQKAYTAHIVVLANKLTSTNDSIIKQACNSHQGWNAFKQSFLKNANEKNSTIIYDPNPISKVSTPLKEFPRTIIPSSFDKDDFEYEPDDLIKEGIIRPVFSDGEDDDREPVWMRYDFTQNGLVEKRKNSWDDSDT